LISSNQYDTPEDSDHRRPRIEWVKLVDAKTHVWACGVFNRCQQMSAVLMTKSSGRGCDYMSIKTS